MSNYLGEYLQEIRAGRIKVGLELMEVLERLEEERENPRYIYDTSDAELRIEFIETFCKHSKDPFCGQPFTLLLWQKAFIEVVYSFKHASTGRDRFKKIILLIARKNGKSTLCAALAFCDFIIGGGGRDIYCSSNDDAQASIIFDEIDAMRRMFDPKSYRTWRNQKGLRNKKNGSWIKKISERTRNKDGRNINFAILDESWGLETNEIPSAIEKSQSIKINPKFINITTEGTVNDGYLDEELEFARQVIRGEKRDKAAERLLPWLYTQDSENEVWQATAGDLEHPSDWQKSNPSLYYVKSTDYIEEQLDEARSKTAARIMTMCKDFNIKQNSASAWLRPDDYNYETELVNLEEWRGAHCLIGIDLSETTDLTAVSCLFVKPEEPDKRFIFTRYFLPAAKLEGNDSNDDKQAGAKYFEWAKAEHVQICDGTELDGSEAAQFIVGLWEKYGIWALHIGYDPRSSKTCINTLKDYGYETEPVRQNKYILSKPTNAVEDLLKHRQIQGLSDVDRWCFGNCSMTAPDKFGDVQVVKIGNQRSHKIDGAVAIIICYKIFQDYKAEFMQYCEVTK